MASGIDGRDNGGGGGADGSSGGVFIKPPGFGSVVLESRVTTTSGEGVEDGRDPGGVELEAITASSSTFYHNAWRVKGIIPSTRHPFVVCSLLKAISHAGLKHFMKCS